MDADTARTALLVAPELAMYALGSQTTATIERCEEGERVPVRATSSAAATLDTPAQSLWLTAFGVALGGVAHFTCWFSFSRQLRKAEAGGT